MAEALACGSGDLSDKEEGLSGELCTPKFVTGFSAVLCSITTVRLGFLKVARRDDPSDCTQSQRQPTCRPSRGGSRGQRLGPKFRDLVDEKAALHRHQGRSGCRRMKLRQRVATAVQRGANGQHRAALRLDRCASACVPPRHGRIELDQTSPTFTLCPSRTWIAPHHPRSNGSSRIRMSGSPSNALANALALSGVFNLRPGIFRCWLLEING